MPHALIVDRVTKEYRIGQLAHATMLREALVNLVRNPFRQRQPKDDLTIWALKDVSFAVETGSVVGIIGRNGAGKSTLLKILSRISYPTSGTIHVEGRVAALLEVGTGFHEELTGRENIYLNGSILGMRKREIDARLDEIIDFAGIDRFIDTPIKRYSSGMRLRLGFSVAAHLQTDVLLVDEVLAVGDVEFQKKCLSKIENLHRGGRTVVFVSHNVVAIEHLCPRTIWIHDGQVRQDGETGEVIQAYLAHFSGNQGTAANLADIEERKGTGDVRLTAIEFIGADGQVMPVVRSGDRVTIRLHYHARADVRDAQFGIDISKSPGIHVAALRTLNSGRLIPRLASGDGYIDAACDFLALMPGRYSVSLWAKGPDADGSLGRYWDVIEHCAMLDVEASDFYGTGRGIDRNSGIVLLRCGWRLGNGDQRGESAAGAPGASHVQYSNDEIASPVTKESR